MGLGFDGPQPTYLTIKAKGSKDREGVEGSNGMPVIEDYRGGKHAPKFTGDLVAISVKEATDKMLYPQIQMTFLDGLEKYIVCSGFGGLITSILNTFAGAVESESNFKEVCLSLYMKNDYPSVGVFIGGEMCKRAWDWKDLQAKTKKVKVNGKDVTDREELDTRLREQIVLINDYLKSLEPKDIMDEIAEVEKNGVEPEDRSKNNDPFKKDDTEDEDMPF